MPRGEQKVADIDDASTAVVVHDESVVAVEGIRTHIRLRAIVNPVSSNSFYLFPAIQMDAAAQEEFQPSNKHFVIVVDDSASMQSGGRIQSQKEIVKSIYKRLPVGTEVTLIAIRATAITLIRNAKKNEGTEAEFLRTVDGLPAVDDTDFYGAFKKAKEAIADSTIPSSATTVVMCSDGQHTVRGSYGSKSADSILKELMDGFAAELTKGIPSVLFIYFTPQRIGSVADHWCNMASLSYRSKNEAVIVWDRRDLSKEAVSAATNAALQASANGYHVYMDAFGTTGQEVTRDLTEGKAKYLGIFNPGSGRMAEALTIPRATFEAREHAPVSFLFQRGGRSIQVEAKIEIVEDALLKDDLLHTFITQRLSKLYSQDPYGREDGTKDLIEEEIMPLIDTLLEGDRKAELLANIRNYLSQIKETSTTRLAQAAHFDPALPMLCDRGTAVASTITITLRKLDGSTRSLEVNSGDKISEFKKNIAVGEGVSVDKIVLILAGKQLQDDQIVRDCANLTALQLIVRAPASQAQASVVAPSSGGGGGGGGGGSSARGALLTVKLKLGSESLTFLMLSSHTVRDVAEKVKEHLSSRGVEELDSMRVVLYADGASGVPLYLDRQLDTLDLTKPFLCLTMRRTQTISQTTINCRILSTGESRLVRLPDSESVTVQLLKQAVNDQFFDGRADLTDISIVVNGKAVQSDAENLLDIEGMCHASTVHVIMRNRNVQVETAGALQPVTEETLTRSGDRATITVLTNEGPRKFAVDRNAPVRDLLRSVLGAGELDPDISLRLMGKADRELDLNRSLAALGMGRDITVALEGSHKLACFQCTDTSFSAAGGRLGELTKVAGSPAPIRAMIATLQAYKVSHAPQTSPSKTGGTSAFFSSPSKHAEAAQLLIDVIESGQAVIEIEGSVELFNILMEDRVLANVIQTMFARWGVKESPTSETKAIFIFRAVDEAASCALARVPSR